jgi:GNAT superfamily N-acetyltransferase
MPGPLHTRCYERLSPREVTQLAEVLIDCVAGGASVSFMAPMTHEKALTYWTDVAESAARGERVVIAALDVSERIVGTAQVIWATPENQPHRADVAKMLVHRDARRRGAGALLLGAAEEAARAAGKALLVLDTASEDAARLYERGGWQKVGVIPDYALWPEGGLCATTVYYKQLQSA